MNNAIPRFEWERSHTFYCIYTQASWESCMYEFWIFQIKSFQSCSATTARSDHVVGVGRVLDTRYLPELEFHANPVFCCISLSPLLCGDSLTRPSQIMQNKTVDHGLTHQAARRNTSVFVQGMPGKTLAVHLWVVQHTKVSFHMGIWARRERPRALTAHFYFLTSFYMFS